MTPMRGAQNSPGESVRRVFIIVLSVLTVVAVPWVIIGKIRDGGSESTAATSTTAQVGSTSVETTLIESPTTVADFLNARFGRRPSSFIAYRIRRCTGLSPSRTSGSARETITLIE